MLPADADLDYIIRAVLYDGLKSTIHKCGKIEFNVFDYLTWCANETEFFPFSCPS